MLTKDEAFRLSRFSFDDLADSAGAMRDEFSKHYISYSPKLYLPLTHTCGQDCEFCSSNESSLNQETSVLSLSDIRKLCSQAVENYCSEAQISFVKSPEEIGEHGTNWLLQNGFNSPVDYLTQVAGLCLVEFGLLPHVNPREISDRELRAIKEVSVSQGMLLETIAGRLSEPGGPLFGIPGKTPARRLATLEAAGRAQIPFSTGVSVGIGDTKHERIEALLTIRDLNSRYGHIQEVLIEKYNQDTSNEEFLWSIAAARLIFESTTHIQAQANKPEAIKQLVRAGIDDLGAMSPITSPLNSNERPWLEVEMTSKTLFEVNRKLRARTAIYPEFISKTGFVAEHIKPFISQKVNSSGYLTTSPLDSGDANFSNPASFDSVQDIVVDLTTEEPAKSASSFKRTKESNFPTSRPRR